MPAEEGFVCCCLHARENRGYSQYEKALSSWGKPNTHVTKGNKV